VALRDGVLSISDTILLKAETFRLFVRACLPFDLTGALSFDTSWVSTASSSRGGRVSPERVTRRFDTGVGSISSVVSVAESIFTVDLRGLRELLVTRPLLRFEGVWRTVGAGSTTGGGGGLVVWVDSEGARVDFRRLLGGGDSTEEKISGSSSSTVDCRFIRRLFLGCLDGGVGWSSSSMAELRRERVVVVGSETTDFTGEEAFEAGNEE